MRPLPLHAAIGNAAFAHLVMRQRPTGDASGSVGLPQRVLDVARTRVSPARTPDTIPIDPTTDGTLPVHVQQGPTCGAASLATALFVRDRDEHDPEHRLFLAVLTDLHAYLRANRQRIIRDNIAPRVGGGAAAMRYFHDEVEGHLTTAAMATAWNMDVAVNELTLVLYNGFRADRRAGTRPEERVNMLLGLSLLPPSNEAVPAQEGLPRYEALFSNRVVATLRPGEAAQAAWWVITRSSEREGPLVSSHAFVIGRHRHGGYYLYDQGRPLILEAPDLARLRISVNAAADAGYWIWRGEPPVLGASEVLRIADPAARTR